MKKWEKEWRSQWGCSAEESKRTALAASLPRVSHPCSCDPVRLAEGWESAGCRFHEPVKTWVPVGRGA